MDNEEKRIGILGGTFDPVHTGHLILAACVKSEMKLDKILFVPCKTPPHKTGMKVTDEKHRMEMVRLAVADNPDFEVSDMEMQKDGPSYTFDTLSDLEAEYGEDTAFYFVMGADALLTIENWYRAEDMLRQFYFVVVNRPDSQASTMHRKVAALNEKYGRHIDIIPITPVDISATDIRRNIKAAASISQMVPPAVERYIFEHGLYQE